MSIIVAFGDGIGPEITDSTLKILANAKADISIETAEIGEEAYKREWTYGLTPSGWQKIALNKILLKAPTTKYFLPTYKNTALTLKRCMGTFINIRPSCTFLNQRITLITGNSQNSFCEYQPTQNVIQAIESVNIQNLSKTCHYAFQYAILNKKKSISCILHHDNSFIKNSTTSSVVTEIARKYHKSIETEFLHITDAIQKIVSPKNQLDVIFIPDPCYDTHEIFCKILNKCTMSCSASIGIMGYGLFEPCHGTANELTGMNIANPIGMIRSAIEMLLFTNKVNTAQMIHNALIKTLEDGIKPHDMKQTGYATLSDFSAAVIDNLGYAPTNFEALNSYPNIHQDTYPIITKRIHIGYDVTLKWDFSDDFTKITEKHLDERLKIESITSDGVIVMPRSGFYPPGDKITIRLITSEDASNIPTIEEIFVYITSLNLVSEVIHITKIYLYGDKLGFSE